MFTGLIETVGEVAHVEGSSPRRVTITCAEAWPNTAIGDSVAINGCCLTVVERAGDGLVFEAATETLQRTTIGALGRGSRVNLERAMQLGARLDGHLVMGHVDGVGQVVVRQQRGSALYLGVELSVDLAKFVASQGSVTLQGVSLTVTSVQNQRFEVGLIPHTLSATTLGDLRVGSCVNIEVDIIARYVHRLLQAQAPTSALTVDSLKDKGFL